MFTLYIYTIIQQERKITGFTGSCKFRLSLGNLVYYTAEKAYNILYSYVIINICIQTAGRKGLGDVGTSN